jgi:outer membrane protein
MKTQNKLFTTTVLFSAMLASMPSQAVEKGDILLDVRILNISPNVNDNQVMAGGAPLAPPAGIDVDSANSLGIDITYMVTNNFGIELMLDTTSTHDIKGTGNLAGVDIGEVTVLPPSVIAVWHFMPSNNIRPYLGAGINYTFFFDESTTSQFTSTIDSVVGGGVTSTGLSVDDAFGFVAQAGVNIDINKKWYVTLDAKYIALDTTATIQVNGANTATVDFDLNPLVLGVGIGTSF